MNNNSSQSRFSKITAKAIVMLLAVVLSISVLPNLSADILPTAEAATEYVVQSGTTVATINSQLNSYLSSGVTEVDLKLAADIDFTDSSSGQYGSGITGIVIPEKMTVNLFMNGKGIYFSRTSGGAWQLPYVYAIHNKGTLNVYSGSSTTATSTTAHITLNNIRTGMSPDSVRELAYCNLEAIRNEGTVTVNKNVQINVNATLHYDEINTSGSLTNDDASQAVSGATAIYNTSDATTCIVDAAKINVYAKAEGTYSSNCGDGERTSSVAVAYGIYGGQVSVKGAAEMTVASDGNHSRDTYLGNASDGVSYLTAIAYNIATNASVYVTGGTFSYDANITNTDAVKSNGGGKQYLFAGGIYTTSGASPVMPDGTFSTPAEDCMNTSDGTVTYRKGSVVTSSEMIKSATEIVTTLMSYVQQPVVVPSASVSAGTFLDETQNNSYSANIATAVNGVPTGITRGAVDGTNRVHIVYRYWKDSGRTQIDSSVVSSDGYLGYSYQPLADGTDVVDVLVSLSGMSSTGLTKAPNSTLMYSSGGDSCNSYYWGLIDLSYSTTSAYFSDFSVTSVTGSMLKNFSKLAPVNNATPAVNGPIYIFVDYARIDPTSVKAKVGTADVVSTTYTGYPIIATEIGLQILDSIDETDYTSEYNVDFKDSDLIGITYSYTGTNTAGVKEESASGQLPKNAGTYTVTLHIDESVTYSKDPKHNKNRYELNYTFTLIIEQASILRGTLPESVTLTYGETLNKKLDISSYKGAGIANDTNIEGVFSFVNASDGSSYKNVGTQSVSIAWTPAYSATANVKNYKATTFNVQYTVNKAPLTITPNRAAVIYGDSEFTTPYSVTITGLVANDTGDSVKATIANALNYMLLSGTEYIPYSAGEVAAGSYSIRARFSTVPDVLSNYEYSYIEGTENNPEGVLRVEKRAVTVNAEAKSRAYAPANFDVSVTFTVTEGKFGVDDIRISTTTGGLSDNTAGTKEVSGITKQVVAELLTGGAAANYYVNNVTYSTGEKLLVEISKAIPGVSTPVVEEMFYQRLRTLKDIDFTGYTATVEGTWQWVDATINPTVNVLTYKAQYVPVDNNNYEIKTVDITIKVKPTPVVITYAGTVSYGDNIPNITAYTYKSDLDPDFDIDSVTTSGNITPYTTYQKGSPVVDGGYAVEISAPNFIDVNGNYTFTTQNGVITVKPRLITFKVEDTSVVYGENFAPSASTVKVTYDEALLVGTDTIEDVTLNGSAPTFVYSTDFLYMGNYQVGSYYLRAEPDFMTSANYEVDSVEGTLYVTKAELVIKAADITLEYGSEIPENISSSFTVVGAKRSETIEQIVSSGSIKVDTTYQQGSPVNIEGYPITVDIASAVFNNYNVTVQHGVITVIKATPVVTEYPTATLIHGQTLADAVFKGGIIENNISGKYVYDTAAAAPAYSSTPYNAYTATFIPDDTVNYNTVKGIIVSLIVNKKPVTGELAVTGIPMIGQTITANVAGLDPDELGVYTITWYYADGSIIKTGSELTLSTSHQLQQLTVKAVANAPYEGTVECQTTVIAPALTDINTILNADTYKNYFAFSEISAIQELNASSESVYNAVQQVVEINKLGAVANATEIGNITVKYNGSTVPPVNVGTYAVTVDVATPDGIESMSLAENSSGQWYDTNSGKIVYSPVADLKIGTLIITPKSYFVYIDVEDKVYDGTGAATIGNVEQYGACAGDEVSFDEATANIYFSSAEVGNDIAVYIAYAGLTGADASNYEIDAQISNDGKANITKRPLYMNVIPVEREYEAGNWYVDLSFEPQANSIADGDDGFVYVDEANVVGLIYDETTDGKKYVDKAGIHSVEVSGVSITGAKAENYELVLANLDGLKVEILKATPFYPIPQTEVLYYDSARPLNMISLGDSRWAWDSEVANEVPGAGSHTYTAVYTPDDTLNYAVVEYDVEVEILKTLVTITAANFTVTYGDTDPTYYYDVSGLTGADTIKTSVDGYVLMNCSYKAGSDVGVYDIVLTGAFESDNYDFIYKNGTVTVNKRAAYVEAIAESREYEPDNLKVNVTFSDISNLYGSDGKNDVFLEGSFPIEGTIDNANAGVKTVKYTMPALAGAKAKNYELRLLNPTLTVEIVKARIAGVVLPASGTIGYGQRLNTINYTSSFEGTEYGTFSMENPTSIVEQIGTFTDVYKVVFTPFNTANYATISEYIVVTVVPSELNIDISFTGTAQVGKSLYAVITGVPSSALEYLYFEWYRLDTPDDDPRNGVRVAAGTDYYTLTDGDSGKYIFCTVTNLSGAPYTCNANCVTDTSVEEEQLTFWQKFVNWFYRIISNITQIFGKLM